MTWRIIGLQRLLIKCNFLSFFQISFFITYPQKPRGRLSGRVATIIPFVLSAPGSPRMITVPTLLKVTVLWYPTFCCAASILVMLRGHFSLNVIRNPITTDCALLPVATPYKALKLKVPLSTMNAKKRFAIVQLRRLALSRKVVHDFFFGLTACHTALLKKPIEWYKIVFKLKKTSSVYVICRPGGR